MKEGVIKGVAALLAFGGTMVYSAINRRKRLRLVEDSARSKTASAPQGFVELEGFAWPADPPLTLANGMDAVFYSLRLEQRVTKGSGKNRRTEWVTVFSRVHGPVFYLVDATGAVTIDPTTAELALDSAMTRSWGRIPAAERERLRRDVITAEVPGFPPSNFLFGLFASRFRLVENEILVGGPIYATGDFRTVHETSENVLSPGLAHFRKKVFHLEGRSARDTARFLDTNGDGKVTERESQLGFALAAKSARLRPPDSPEEPVGLYGSLGNSDQHKLYLADVHESHLRQRLRRGLWFRLAGGAAMIALAITLSINEFRPGTVRFGLPRVTHAYSANPQRRPAASSQRPAAGVPAVAAIPVLKLHQDCVSGTAQACESLLNAAEAHTVQLSMEHVTYYGRRACGLGLARFCR